MNNEIKSRDFLHFFILLKDMLNHRINKLFLVLCLLLSLNAFAQKNDSLDIQDVDPAVLLDSIDYYQNLIEDTEAEVGDIVGHFGDRPWRTQPWLWHLFFE